MPKRARPKPTPKDPWVTPREAAEILGMAYTTYLENWPKVQVLRESVQITGAQDAQKPRYKWRLSVIEAYAETRSGAPLKRFRGQDWTRRLEQLVAELSRLQPDQRAECVRVLLERAAEIREGHAA